MALLIAAFPDVESMGKKIARALGAEFTTINALSFPDSEYHLKIRKNPSKKTVIIISSISKNVDDKLIETILACGVAKDYKAKKVILVATYLPYMRQDKHFEKFDSFSAKHILELFSYFDKVIAIDPHLHRIKNINMLLHKAESLSVNQIVADYIKKNFKGDFEIIGPDLESEQWSANIAHILNKKVIILEKERLGDRRIRQKIVKFDKNKNHLLIDDIISTGKTLVGALKMAKKQGAKKLICIGIHGILVGNADREIKRYAKLITTNSVLNKYSKIDISPAIIERLKKEK